VATALVTVAAFMAVLLIAGTDSATSPVVDTTPDGTVSDRFLSINDIPWAPATAPRPPVVDQRAAMEAELEAIRTGGGLGVPSADADRTVSDHFLSINDADQPAAPSATMAEGERAFFLSINDVDE
jgi:hypothetical protein